jgi:hypothetical protein
MKYKPLLIDLDGVLKLSDSPASDAIDFIKIISDGKIYN